VDLERHVFLTSALDGGEWSASRPGRFTRGEKSTPYSLDRRPDGPQSQSWRGGEEKSFIIVSTGNLTPVVQPEA
jgi:hypothetical protein